MNWQCESTLQAHKNCINQYVFTLRIMYIKQKKSAPNTKHANIFMSPKAFAFSVLQCMCEIWTLGNNVFF
jgi:hypothetical protein